jgi:hypothetical protein
VIIISSSDADGVPAGISASPQFLLIGPKVNADEVALSTRLLAEGEEVLYGRCDIEVDVLAGK